MRQILHDLKSNKRTYIILTIIFIVAAALRFYRLPDMANYDFDQEYASNFAYSVIHDHLKLLIGQGLSVEGLFMGPWYFYFLTPFFAITNLHPLGGYIGSVTLGLATILVYFFIAKKMFGNAAGLIAAFFRAFLFTQIGSDWTMVPAYSSDLGIIVVWYCLYRYWHKDTRYLPLMFLFMGFFTSFHPTQFPFYLIFAILVLIIRQLPTIKQAILSIIAFLLPQAPLILFEHWHSWLEVKRLISLFSEPSSQSHTLIQLWSYLIQNLREPQAILNLQTLPWPLVLISFWAVLLWLIWRKVGFWKDKFHAVALLITLVVFLLYYWRFPTHVPEYYFLAIPTLITLYLAATLSLVLKQQKLLWILPIALVWIFVSNFNSVINRWNNPSLITLSHKDAIVREILNRQPGNQLFYISYIKEPGWNFGFEYLFKLYGRTSSGNRGDPVYTIVIPKQMSPDSIQFSSGNIGLIYPDKK